MARAGNYRTDNLVQAPLFAQTVDAKANPDGPHDNCLGAWDEESCSKALFHQNGFSALIQTFAGLFFGTYLLEDAALASALALVSRGSLPTLWAFLACFLGISSGDLLLYGLGWGASRS